MTHDVDAAIDAFCANLFGPAAKPMRELLGMQIDGWEKSAWPGGRFSPKGVYEVTVCGETFKAKAGDILYYPPGELHSEQFASAEIEVFGIGFGNAGAVPLIFSERRGQLYEQLPTLYNKPGVLRGTRLRKSSVTRLPEIPLFSRDPTGRIEAVVRLMREIWSDHPPRAQQILNAFLEAILLQYRKKQVASEHPVVTTVRQYIHDNYQKRIVLNDLVHVAHASKYYLVRVFRGATGFAPMDYVRRIRVQAARLLLMGTDLPLKAIAERVGFSDEYLLGRHFRKIMGSTPGSIRKPAKKL